MSMIDTKIVMPRAASPQTRTFSTAATSGFERKDAPTMKAIYLEKQAGPEGLVAGEIPRPSSKEDEVLVKVHATAVTPSEFDWLTTFNLPFGEPRSFPIVLSHEFSGVVASVGARAIGFSPGDEVFGMSDWFTNGAQAEYCVAKATALARKPRPLYHVQAATVPISALTAWQALFSRAKLERHQRILIHGAAGSVGSFGVQLARWCGAHVIAPISSGQSDFVRSLGADEVFDYRTTRFEDVVKEVEVVFDAVGGETLERSWGVLAEGGRVVTVAPQSKDARDPRARNAFMMVQADGQQLAQIGRMIAEGELRACLGTIFPLAAAKLAYARARQSLRRGKVALRVAELYASSKPQTDN
jgi:NADPH:quinone reductase-like Zn-dependent oxidoreductase